MLVIRMLIKDVKELLVNVGVIKIDEKRFKEKING